MSFVETLEPRALWRHFDRILEIPRPSRKEERIRTYVLSVASRRGLEALTDAAGNVVVRKPATAGAAGAATTVLQAHLDMVGEKNSDTDHDFDSDPLRPLAQGDFLTADGTTLGSDNGIGVAAMLALLETDDVAHGPLELLFTIDEETGLTGAAALDPGPIEGRLLINLDSEEEGAVYVGCAGGAGSTLSLPIERSESSEARALELTVSGLRGGHSGVDIDLQRGNAIKILARTLFVAAEAVPLRLLSVDGGSAHNAIPREASASLVTDDPARARERITAEFEFIRAELAKTDPETRIQIDELDPPTTAWSEASTRRALALLAAVPHGVLAMSQDLTGLVETSTNLARVEETAEQLVVSMSSRGSVASALEAARTTLRAIAELAGAAVAEAGGYPGWQPNLDSPLLQITRRVHQRLFGEEPEIKAIHAGLECGILGEKLPGVDMVSFGPRIEFPHSPDERVHIASVERFYRLLCATLEELAA